MQAFNTRVRITVTSYRKRPCDPDNVVYKWGLDGVVALGILRDDSAEQIEEIRLRQVKSEEEKTIIRIEELTHG